MATKEAAVLVELPGLSAIAQQKFDLPYEELSPSLQSHVREEAVRRAGNDMLAALKRAANTIEFLQAKSMVTGSAERSLREIRAAIALAEGK